MAPDRYSADSPYVVTNIAGFERELELLLGAARLRHYGPGEVVYVQGEKSSYFYFVRTGRVKVSIFKESGAEKILAIQEANTFFGESAAFDRYPYFATATVLEDSEIFRIEIARAEALIRENPDVAFMVIVAIIRKLRLLGLQVEDLSFLDAQKRVAHILLKLAQEVGTRTDAGIAIRKRMTHEDLANLTGLSRVTVTNTLNHLAKLRTITKQRQEVTIIDRERLLSLVEAQLEGPGEAP